MVPVSEHPLYNKYFKMMKVGLPKEAIKAKMIQEGANPLYLEKEPSELVPLTEPKVPEPSQKLKVSIHMYKYIYMYMFM